MMSADAKMVVVPIRRMPTFNIVYITPVVLTNQVRVDVIASHVSVAELPALSDPVTKLAYTS